MVEAFSCRIIWNFPHTYPGVLQKRSFILQAVWQSFHYLVVMSWKMFQASFSHASFRLAQNGKSFAWDWKIIRLRTFYRFPQWKKAERCLKHPSFRNILYHNLLSYNLKDEGSFLQNLGECVGTRICGCRSTYTKIGGKACMPFLLSYFLFKLVFKLRCIALNMLHRHSGFCYRTTLKYLTPRTYRCSSLNPLQLP